ncbi:MAG: DUF460 domain-containing protein [Candidatus Woesearchaeota archaeon]
MQPVIVGIDPGTTSAFAILSFDFKVLKVKSKKNYSFPSLIYDIYKFGLPIIVATDKKDIPSFIKEFSQKTGAKIYNPKYDTKKGEKHSIVKEKGFLDYCKNTHETDALASALFAYREYYPIIRKIKNYVEENKKHNLKDLLIIKVLNEDKNITKAVNELEKKTETKKIEVKKIKEIINNVLTKEEKEVYLLKKTIDKLRFEIETLKKENKVLKEKRIDINEEIKKIISFKEKKALSLIKENNFLRERIKEKNIKIRELNEFILKTKNSVLVKKLKNLSNVEYEKKKDILKIEKDDIIFIENFDSFSENVFNNLKENIKFILYNSKKVSIENDLKYNLKDSKNNIIEVLKKYFFLIDINKFTFYENENFVLINKDEFKIISKKLINETNKNDLLKEIIENYKQERKKELFE